RTTPERSNEQVRCEACPSSAFQDDRRYRFHYRSRRWPLVLQSSSLHWGYTGGIAEGGPRCCGHARSRYVERRRAIRLCSSAHPRGKTKPVRSALPRGRSQSPVWYTTNSNRPKLKVFQSCDLGSCALTRREQYLLLGDQHCCSGPLILERSLWLVLTLAARA